MVNIYCGIFFFIKKYIFYISAQKLKGTYVLRTNVSYVLNLNLEKNCEKKQIFFLLIHTGTA